MDASCREKCRNMPAGMHAARCPDPYQRLHRAAADMLSSIHMLADADVKILQPQIRRLTEALEVV